MPYTAHFNLEKCKDCGTCREIVVCSGRDNACIGCGACYLACPNKAIEIVEDKRASEVTIKVNGKTAQASERIPIKETLSLLGYSITCLPKNKGIFAPCEVGACFSCAVEIDGVVKPACITGIKDGMSIKTNLPEDYVPKRIVSGFMGHMVGGVGTPWRLKGGGYIEVACFTGGCNLRCPQCQNWTITYGGKGRPLTPKEAAYQITSARYYFGVNRMAISGGECTLNRSWLIQYIKELKALNPDSQARFHVDTNGSLLTPDYIDDLVNAGMTDIGIDLKALELSTFQDITGLKDKVLAQTYMDNARNAVHYILKHYKNRIFLGIGIPYNKDLISKEEIKRLGEKIYTIDPEVQVCALDYRREFRSDIKRPAYEEMVEIYNVLKNTGLKTVVCQTTHGHIGP